MIFNGVIKEILAPVSGSKADGTQWTKRGVVIEAINQGQYPDTVVAFAFGDRASMLDTLAQGDAVTAYIDLKATQYNGKWFLNANVFRIEKGAQQQPTQQPLQQAAPQPVQQSTIPPQPYGGELPF